MPSAFRDFGVLLDQAHLPYLAAKLLFYPAKDRYVVYLRLISICAHPTLYLADFTRRPGTTARHCNRSTLAYSRRAWFLVL